MVHHLTQVTSHKGLRAEILLGLKRAQPLTAKQLARELDVSTNAIRHHLKELQAESLIVYGREQRGLGAPTFAYRLSFIHFNFGQSAAVAIIVLVILMSAAVVYLRTALTEEAL